MTHEMTSMTRKSLSVTAVVTILLIASAGGYGSAGEPNRAGDYFAIQVVDSRTGRGVPLVELRTTNLIRCFTDSNGIVAFLEPGLMDREVFFFVESHGYEYPKDGFGFRGVRLRTTPGTTAVVKIDRINIAERLYRVTGQGIYRDSILVGRTVPLKNPVLNAQVIGQDSVDACLYHGRLFWTWGDTGRPGYPLGHFAMAGAVSDLPGRGGLDPAVGVDLDYFVDKDGFSRPVARLKEPGLVWLDGFLVVRDNDGREHMVAKYARLKDLGHVLERGLMVFNDDTGSFEPIVRSDPNLLPYPDFGHAFRVEVEGRLYYYFALPFPLTVRMRVEAKWDRVIDPNRYEVLTASQGGRDRWVTFADIAGADASARAHVTETLKREKGDVRFLDVESGKEVTPHGGSVYFNAHRHKWIALFLQAGGESSYIGEVWYAEADTPVGPWAYARKVATHNKYSFYNPKQHPYFDQNGGRTIYFEGTYSWTFSGSEERATPRYDYNQIMYRLDLDDPRLVLPVAVYQVRDGQDRGTYLLSDAIAERSKWDDVESAAFYAIEPGRGDEHLVCVYADRLADGNVRLTTESQDTSAEPLFLAMPPDGQAGANPCIVPLYEYRHADSGRFRYSTQAELREPGWNRGQQPLCRVWKASAGPLLLDRQARPADAL
ncbi:MAG TPA: hypothetical protein PKH24_17315 [Sedimentisphaerales bacterium]|nr:hypothetical protein [Sedimentisphaerales bacterium]HNU30706.1 hypothetical protein [Sedimentisphaerales bacterium]